MIGILIVTHGGFAEGLKNAVELIVGKQENMESIGVYHGDGVDAIEDKVSTALKRLNQGEGVLVFVDIVGGTPSNTIFKYIKNEQIRALSDVNMPMVVNAVFNRTQNTLDELCNQCVEIGKSPPTLLHEKYTEFANLQEDDNF